MYSCVAMYDVQAENDLYTPFLLSNDVQHNKLLCGNYPLERGKCCASYSIFCQPFSIRVIVYLMQIHIVQLVAVLA